MMSLGLCHIKSRLCQSINKMVHCCACLSKSTKAPTLHFSKLKQAPLNRPNGSSLLLLCTLD